MLVGAATPHNLSSELGPWLLQHDIQTHRVETGGNHARRLRGAFKGGTGTQARDTWWRPQPRAGGAHVLDGPRSEIGRETRVMPIPDMARPASGGRRRARCRRICGAAGPDAPNRRRYPILGRCQSSGFGAATRKGWSTDCPVLGDAMRGCNRVYREWRNRVRSLSRPNASVNCRFHVAMSRHTKTGCPILPDEDGLAATTQPELIFDSLN